MRDLWQVAFELFHPFLGVQVFEVGSVVEEELSFAVPTGLQV